MREEMVALILQGKTKIISTQYFTTWVTAALCSSHPIQPNSRKVGFQRC
jgi:hypothetical protein